MIEPIAEMLLVLPGSKAATKPQALLLLVSWFEHSCLQDGLTQFTTTDALGHPLGNEKCHGFLEISYFNFCFNGWTYI